MHIQTRKKHQNFITSRKSPLAHAYHVWSTSVTAIISYHPAHRMTDRMTERPITLLGQPPHYNYYQTIYIYDINIKQQCYQ